MRTLEDINADIYKMSCEKAVIQNKLNELNIEYEKCAQYNFEQKHGLKRGDLVELSDGKRLYYDFVKVYARVSMWVYCRKPKKDGSPTLNTVSMLDNSFINCKIVGHKELP